MPRHRLPHRLIWLVILILVIWLGWRWLGHSGSSHSSGSGGGGSAAARTGSSGSVFNKKQYSIDQAGSLWVIVNKARVLPSTYVPANLVTPNVPLRLAATDPEMHMRADAAAGLERLVAGAHAAGVNLRVSSGYRSYADQAQLYQYYVATQGSNLADESSARPGHSEHQTGLAVDVAPTSGACDIQQCFSMTPEGQWLAANAYKYGFIVRYQNGSQPITGYEFEPWHIRFVGTDLAAQLYSKNQTMEQFFGLPPAPNYAAAPKQLSQ